MRSRCRRGTPGLAGTDDGRSNGPVMATAGGQRHCHQGHHDYRPEHEPDDAALTSRRPRSSQRRPLMASPGGRCCGVLIAGTALWPPSPSFL